MRDQLHDPRGYQAPNRSDRLFMRWLNGGTFVLSGAAMLLAAIGVRPGQNFSTLYSDHPNVLTPSVWNLWIWALLHALGGAFALYQGCAMATAGGKLRSLFDRLDPGFAIANLLAASWALTVLWNTVDAAVWIGMVALVLLEVTLVVVYFKTQVWQVTRTNTIEFLAVDLFLSCYTAWVAISLCSQLAAAVVAVEGAVSVPLGCAALGLLATASLLASRRADPVFGLVACWGFAGIAARRVQERSVEGERGAMIQAVAWTLGGLVLLLSLWTGARLCWKQHKPWNSGRSGPTFVSARRVRPYSEEAYRQLDSEHEQLRAEFETVCPGDLGGATWRLGGEGVILEC